MKHLLPQLLGRVVEEHARVEQVVCRPRLWRDWSWFCESSGVLERCVTAVLLAPVFWSPRVALLVADTGVIGGNPIAREISLVVEYAIYATVEYRHISVEVAYRIVVEELEDTELGPGVCEALSNQPDFDVRRRQQQINLVEDQIQLLLLELEGLYGRVRDARRVVHNQRVLRAVLAKRVSKDDDAREVAPSGNESGVRVLLATGSIGSGAIGSGAIGVLGSFTTQAGI